MVSAADLKASKLTRKQFRVYSLLYVGHTHQEIADIIGVHRPQVTMTLSRAKARNPELPEPIRHGRHRKRAA